MANNDHAQQPPDGMLEALADSDRTQAISDQLSRDTGVAASTANPDDNNPHVKVKMLADSTHPDLGELKKGKTYEVDVAYARDYIAAGIAE